MGNSNFNNSFFYKDKPKPTREYINLKKVGERIRRLRKEHGYTQKELAFLCCVSESTFRMWELGKNMPPVSALYYLGVILGVYLNYFFSDNNSIDFAIIRDKKCREYALLLDHLPEEKRNDIFKLIDREIKDISFEWTEDDEKEYQNKKTNFNMFIDTINAAKNIKK